MKNILPDWLYCLLMKNYHLESIHEIRIRLNKPIQLNYKSKLVELSNDSGLYPRLVIANQDLIDYIIESSTNKSLYAFENQIRMGYISTAGGIRIGLCGTAVYDNDKIIMIKNITSLNIRIAHNVVDCSKTIINYLVYNSCVKNTLIISPPGAGKTTLIRDLVCKLSNEYFISNIMVIDEKYEFVGDGVCFDLGKNVDVMMGAEKQFAFFDAIKVMNPNVIVADEIVSENDIEGVKFAVRSGVSVIASAHAKNIDEIKSKRYFSSLLEEKYFERIVVLSKIGGVGKIEGVFDENFRPLYLPYL